MVDFFRFLDIFDIVSTKQCLILSQQTITRRSQSSSKKIPNSQIFKTNGGVNGFLNSDKKTSFVCRGDILNVFVIVGHFEGFLFWKWFPGQMVNFCLLHVIHQKAMFYRYDWDILGHFQCILWGIRFLLLQ